MVIEMNLKGLMIDPITNMPIIVLKDGDGRHVLPIWVGVFEANAIALQMENVQTPRPMTHDLLKNVIDDLNATVDRIVVSELKDNTFYATIHLSSGMREPHRRLTAVRCDRTRSPYPVSDLRGRGSDRKRQEQR